jgi:hypothetical protein
MNDLVHKEMSNPTVIERGVQVLLIQETPVVEQPQRSTEVVPEEATPVITDMKTPVTIPAETPEHKEHKVINEEISADIQTE